MSNIALWEKVCTTDPRYTKEFSRSGGFKGTAINPTYQLMKATEVFGPVGLGWGWDIVKEDYVPGADGEVNHVIRLELWYLITPEFVAMMPKAEPFIGQKCAVTHFGQTTFVGKNKFGQFTDEEAPKKSLTDAISKALSCLGFSADIHLGLYDSNKYVNDRKAEFHGDKTATPSKAAVKAVEAPAVWSAEVETTARETIAKLADAESVQKYFIELRAKYALRDPSKADALSALTETCKKRVADLKGMAELKAAAGVETREAA